MRTLTVALGERSYPVHLARELPGALVAREAARVRAGGPTVAGAPPALVVTDSHVGPLYGDGVARALAEVGFRVAVHTVPAGEGSKTLETVGGVLDRALAEGLSRKDLVVALGGGVVGDLAGFAAAVLLRGVPFLQVPTTLLAQVDSSVGGKTGVNHPRGKNLIGAFWQPRAVVASHAVLLTLPERERRCGLAEALKHGLLADAELTGWALAHADALRALEPGPTLTLVEACCRIKADVVAADEREAGRRALLNLGHTLGHAYERLLGYGTLTHGEAVALGLVHAARLSETLGVAAPGLTDEVTRLLAAVGLPHDPEEEGLPDVPALLEAARSDKKAEGDHVRFVLLERIGAATTRILTWDDIATALGDDALARRR